MNYEYLKQAIVDAIKENHRQEITGDLLQQILLGMVDNMTTYRYMGIATTETHPVGTDSNIMFVASESGTYTYMGGLTVGANEFAILKRDTEWHKDVLLASATAAKAGLFTAQDKSRLDTYEARYSQLATAIAQALDDVTAALADIQGIKTEIEEIKETVITAVREATSAAQSATTAAQSATTAANLAQQKAEAAETAAQEAMEAATQVVNIVKGYYYNGSFYEDEEHETEITPSESKVYIDRTEGAVNQQYLWDGEVFEPVAIDSRDVQQALQQAQTAVTNANEALEEVTDLKEQVEAYIGMGKETVVVTVTTSVQGVSVEGLVLNVYLNNSTTPDQYTTDEDGMVAFRVDSGYTYRIVFPEIEGCAGVGDVIHTASVAQRSIEVEYKAAASVYETLTFIAHKSTDSSAFSGVSMVVTYDGEGHTYTTGSDGKVTAQIPLGKSYSVALQRPTGYYFLGGSSFNYTAEQSQRIIYGRLASANIGVFIVCSNGDEITLDNWSTSGHVATDAIAIKIATTELYDNNGVFAISIDEMGVTQNTSYPKQEWSSDEELFTSIPTNGGNPSQPYYYDGMTASQLIQTEGDTIGVDTPAADWALAKSLTLSGIEHHGFLLSLGQMTILWQNSAEIDAILDTVRPTHAYTLRGLSEEKWTSTQYSVVYSWYVDTAQYAFTKSNNFVVVVAYDFN